MATRWGIIDVGNWSHDFAASIQTFRESEHKLVAVVSRYQAVAEDFAGIYGIPKAYGSYEEFSKDEDVEVVYITTGDADLHCRVAKMMLNSGKHVLYQRPWTMFLKQIKQLIKLAKIRRLFLMEAIWSRCFPTYDIIRRELETGTIGDVTRVGVRFPVDMPDHRGWHSTNTHGESIPEFIGYSVQLALLAFGHKKPTSIQTTRCQLHIAIIMYFSDEADPKAVFLSDGFRDKPIGARMIGTKDQIVFPNFWCPINIRVPSTSVMIPLPEPKRKLNLFNGAGLAYMASEVRNCLQRGLTKSPKITNANTLLIAEIQEDILRELAKQNKEKIPHLERREECK